MAVSYSTARFLMPASRQAGLGRTATLGRLEMLVAWNNLVRLADEFGLDRSLLPRCLDRYADTFLRSLCGASTVEAIDHSGYEGAAIIHDLNVPVADELEEQFDTIIDGGTLEHVFNFPIALASCMRMLRPGGRLFLFAPANSLMGHGFYQFSPELLYRALSQPHGFEVERMQVVQSRYVSTELATVGRPLDVADPAELGVRTVVAGRHPLSLHVQARKLRHLTRPFEVPPQQSDYVRAWDHSAAGTWSAVTSVTARAFGRLPGAIRWPLWNTYGRAYRNTLRNRVWFRRRA